MSSTTLYRTLWRWHFYAGLFVLPFVLLLALSGSVYLFKPQLDRWEERAYNQTSTAGPVSPSQQVRAALAAFPGATFHSYRVPASRADAVLVHLELQDGAGMRDVFVSADGVVLGSLDAGLRITEVARRIHGQLLLGDPGSWLVELAACWAIVMLVSGLYLWWPRGRGAAGVLWPRRGALLRDLHAVTGFWAAVLAMILLLTGLPWTSVWGNAFGKVRAQMGWVQGAPAWSTGDASAPQGHGGHGHDHAAHDHQAMHSGHSSYELARLDDIIPPAMQESLPWPTVVMAPGVARFGVASPDWLAISNTQNRPLGRSITYGRDSGTEVARTAFAGQHVVDRVVGYGLAWHEGALFGAINQIVGLLTALALCTLGVTGFLMWRRRRPAGVLGAPQLPAARNIPLLVSVTILVLAALLPLLAASLLLLWMLDLLLPRLSPAAAGWLGITRTPDAR